MLTASLQMGPEVGDAHLLVVGPGRRTKRVAHQDYRSCKARLNGVIGVFNVQTGSADDATSFCWAYFGGVFAWSQKINTKILVDVVRVVLA